MTSKRTIVGNAAWNWAGMAINMAAGFVTAPFLVRHLGETNYGLWIVIASFTSYFGMLDLGVRGAVGRQIAFHMARGDYRGVNATLSTALAILGAAGTVALLGSFGASLAITRIFEVPPDQIHAARIALVLIGVNLMLWLPLNVFDATLWAHQRFDLLNAIDITAVFIRTASTFLLIGHGYGLVALAWLNLISLAGAQAAKGMVSFRLDTRLRARWTSVGREAARELMGFGIWSFFMSAARTVTNQASPIIIGTRLGIGMVTPYSVASRLVGYGGALIVAGTGVLTPVATAMHAAGGLDRQRGLFVEGGKYCFALALYLVAMFSFLGPSIITAWMGPSLASSSTLLTILTLGEWIPSSQWVTQGIILGMGRHRPLAVANLIEGLIALTFAFLLGDRFGLVGVCVAFAIPATFCRGVFPLVYGCHLLGFSTRQYLLRVISPVLSVSAIPIALLWFGVTFSPPDTRLKFILYAGLFSMMFGTLCLIFLVGPRTTKALAATLIRKPQLAEAH